MARAGSTIGATPSEMLESEAATVHVGRAESGRGPSSISLMRAEEIGYPSLNHNA